MSLTVFDHADLVQEACALEFPNPPVRATRLSKHWPSPRRSISAMSLRVSVGSHGNGRLRATGNRRPRTSM